jgi:hypothetical protein
MIQEADRWQGMAERKPGYCDVLPQNPAVAKRSRIENTEMRTALRECC